MATKRFTHIHTRTVTEVVKKVVKKNMVLYFPFETSNTAIRYNLGTTSFQVTTNIDVPDWEPMRWDEFMEWETPSDQAKFLQNMIQLIKETK